MTRYATLRAILRLCLFVCFDLLIYAFYEVQ